jgi:hypothetical protein
VLRVVYGRRVSVRPRSARSKSELTLTNFDPFLFGAGTTSVSPTTTRSLPQSHSLRYPTLESSILSTYPVKGKLNDSLALAHQALSSDMFSYSADPTEKTFTLFGKIKGRAETALLSLPSTPAHSALRVYNARPAYIYSPVRDRPRSVASTVVDYLLGPPLRMFMPSMVSPTGALSKVLVGLATGDGNALQGSGIEAGGRTLRNVAIRRLAGL